MMYANLQRQIATAFQASPIWALTVPGDAANGLSSTAWSPVQAEIARHVGAGASVDQKRAVYMQVVEMLKQLQALAQKASSLGPPTGPERQAFTGLLNALLLNYTQLLNNT